MIKCLSSEITNGAAFNLLHSQEPNEGNGMIIAFDEIKRLVPAYIFNEYGQLTGNYVHSEQIVCEADGGRIRIWLNQEAFDSKDPERLICDYDEVTLRQLGGKGM